MLLAYREKPSFFAVGQRVGVHHQTVQRCIERALAYGPLMALDDRPRPGKEPTITPEAKAWLVSLACDKAKDHGYAHELWTTRLLARHARERDRSAHWEGPRPGQGASPQPRVHRIPQAPQHRLPGGHGDQGDPGQPLGAYLRGNPSLARYSAGGPLRVHLHAPTRILAKPHRGLLLQVRPLGSAPHPGGIKKRTKGTHHARHQGRQSTSGHPHMVLQTRRGCLI